MPVRTQEIVFHFLDKEMGDDISAKKSIKDLALNLFGHSGLNEETYWNVVSNYKYPTNTSIWELRVSSIKNVDAQLAQIRMAHNVEIIHQDRDVSTHVSDDTFETFFE